MKDCKEETNPLKIQPQEIENRSFAEITEEVGEHSYTTEQYKVVQRIIHASADFELGKSMIFHPDAMEAGINAIKKGRPIFTDTKMVQVGINKTRLAEFNVDVYNFISDDDVTEEAKKAKITRSIVSMRKAAKTAEGGIYVIGNAPTALLEILRLVENGEAKPDLIIGVPVGFVSVLESKEALLKTKVPYITNNSRKGGSTIVVAAVNAITILAQQN